MAEKKRQKRIGLVLSGGGARGAYEAGIIHYIRTMLSPKEGGRRTFEIQCSSSVGALNSCFMAATAQDSLHQGKGLYKAWATLNPDDIYRRDLGALGQLFGRSTTGMLRNLLRFKPVNSSVGPHFNAFLDNSPFHKFVEKIIPWADLKKNVETGKLQAACVTATNVATGQTELFIKKHKDASYTGRYIAHFTDLSSVHILASAAIPLIFPTIEVNGEYYIDGGLRLNTPMSPAIQLGAEAVFTIGLHHYLKPGEVPERQSPPGVRPSLGQVVGKVMNSVFLDRVQYDIEQLERINHLIEVGEKVYGKKFLWEVNETADTIWGRRNVQGHRIKKINGFHITPSEDIGLIYRDCFEKAERKPGRISAFEKVLVRFLDIDPKAGVDFLSYLSFIPEYIKTLLDLGFEDARRQHDKLAEFMTL